MEQRLYWSRKSIPERLAAMTELTRRMYKMRGSTSMNPKQTSLLAAFAAAKVEYAVVGGVAVNIHGFVRATHDLDIFIRPTEENARAAFGALLALGVPLEGLEPNDLLNDEETLRFGPEEDHIDILAAIGEMSFDQVWRNRVEVQVEELSVPFISKAGLIANKRQVGRLRDLADVEELESSRNLY